MMELLARIREVIGYPFSLFNDLVRRIPAAHNPHMSTQYRGIVWHQLMCMMLAHILYHFQDRVGFDMRFVLVFSYITAIATIIVFGIDILWDFCIREKKVHTSNRTWKQVAEQHRFERDMSRILARIIGMGGAARLSSQPAQQHGGGGRQPQRENNNRQQQQDQQRRERENDQRRGEQQGGRRESQRERDVDQPPSHQQKQQRPQHVVAQRVDDDAAGTPVIDPVVSNKLRQATGGSRRESDMDVSGGGLHRIVLEPPFVRDVE